MYRQLLRNAYSVPRQTLCARSRAQLPRTTLTIVRGLNLDAKYQEKLQQRAKE
mgnify:CR=1 FL=1